MPRFLVTVTYEMTVEAPSGQEAIEDAVEELGEMMAEGDNPALWGVAATYTVEPAPTPRPESP